METLLFILSSALSIGLIWCLMALGVFISYRILNFADLTSEGSITLGAAIATSLIVNNTNFILATIIAVCGGFVMGAITGILHTKLKIPHILAGIITMTALHSINLRVMGRASLYIGEGKTIYSWMMNVFKNPFLAKTLATLLIVGIVFFVLYWFFGTEIGMSIRSTGINQKMSRAQGINTDLMIILGLALANGLIALSGALIAQNANSANMDIGKGTIVIGLASIIIGEVIFGKRTFKNCLISVILGSIIYQGLVALAIELGVNPNDLKILQAILISIILFLPVFKQQFFSKKEGSNYAKGA